MLGDQFFHPDDVPLTDLMDAMVALSEGQLGGKVLVVPERQTAR